MNTSDKGLALISQLEGVRLTAYRDSVGIATIGVGHTGPDVYMGQTITADECTALLRADVQTAEDAVTQLVNVALTQDQFDALVSFVFNLGQGNFEQSTLLKKINASDFDGAANQFQFWDKAGGHELPGLLKRRLAEASLFRGEL
jgi:lysozyme